MQGAVLDSKYQIVRQLGKGGMGAVYEARHLGTGRRVAVKVIVPEALLAGGDIIVRFQREARASGAIESEHVVQVLDTGVDPGTNSPYMVMEHLTGEDVSQLVRRLGPLPPDLVLRIMAQACIGLSKAHYIGIVHRDIKSANIFLALREGGETIVKILDFGIAKVRADQLGPGVDHALTRTGSMLGSPLYMSPEQAQGLKNLDARSDIFSLGVMMYEALCGETPNAACDTLGKLIIAIVSEKARPIQEKAPWVAREIAAIVHRALAVDPKHRYQTTDQMLGAIQALQPDGCALHESMLAAVPDHIRNTIAPRFEETPSLASLPADASGASSVSGAMAVSGSTASDFGGTHDKPNERGTTLPMIVVAAVVLVGALGVLAVVGGRVLTQRSKASDAASTSATSSVSAASANVAASTSASAGQAPLADIHVTLAVPRDAKVQVDGVEEAVIDGGVEVAGGLGTKHFVHLSVGSNEARGVVAITDEGAVPARMDLGSVAIGGGQRKGHGADHGTKQATGAAAQPPPRPVTPQPQPPPKSNTTPGVSREM